MFNQIRKDHLKSEMQYTYKHIYKLVEKKYLFCTKGCKDKTELIFERTQ